MRGVSLYIAVVIMAILLAIVLGISTILVSQIKIIRGMENSVIALYAAETGIEEVLMDRSSPSSSCSEASPCSLANGATYYIDIVAGGVGNCPGTNSYCVKSVGNYSGTNRAIQASY